MFRLKLEPEDGEGLAWAYRHGQVRERRDKQDGVELLLTADPQESERFVARFGENLLMEQGIATNS